MEASIPRTESPAAPSRGRTVTNLTPSPTVPLERAGWQWLPV